MAGSSCHAGHAHKMRFDVLCCVAFALKASCAIEHAQGLALQLWRLPRQAMLS